MTNVEYIFEFANKHNFPQSECEVVFNIPDDGVTPNIYATDDDIISVKFDKSIVENEIKIEDIRFDIDSDFPEDVFFMWQKDNPEMSFRGWIAMGKYIPTIIKNTEFFDELEVLTKDIEMKLESLFANIEMDDGNSDFEDEDNEDGEDD
jgi:hypothetical protein